MYCSAENAIADESVEIVAGHLGQHSLQMMVNSAEPTHVLHWEQKIEMWDNNVE